MERRRLLSAGRFDAILTVIMGIVTIAFLSYAINERYLRAAPIILEPPLPSEPISLIASQTRGASSARIAIVEYSDFLCPACLTLARHMWPVITEQYVDTGKVVASYRYFPAKSGDQQTWKTFEAAACAAREGQFWQMHDALFSRERDPRNDDLITAVRGLAILGEGLGMNRRSLEVCLSGSVKDEVFAQVGAALPLEIRATPTLFIGQIQGDGQVRLLKRIGGAIPAAELAPILDELLQAGGE
jgi:protein-disulfide isomerase